MADLRQKKQFARLLRDRPKDPYAVACIVLGKDADPGRIMEVCATWPYDKAVVREIARLDRKPVPKHVLVCKLMEIAKDNNKDRVAALAKVAELEGYTAAAATAGKSKHGADKIAELKAMLDEG